MKNVNIYLLDVQSWASSQSLKSINRETPCSRIDVRSKTRPYEGNLLNHQINIRSYLNRPLFTPRARATHCANVTPFSIQFLFIFINCRFEFVFLLFYLFSLSPLMFWNEHDDGRAISFRSINFKRKENIFTGVGDFFCWSELKREETNRGGLPVWCPHAVTLCAYQRDMSLA